ncbi:hypothetical protein ACJX0J_007677, partial [Zea mays]
FLLNNTTAECAFNTGWELPQLYFLSDPVLKKLMYVNVYIHPHFSGIKTGTSTRAGIINKKEQETHNEVMETNQFTSGTTDSVYTGLLSPTKIEKHICAK